MGLDARKLDYMNIKRADQPANMYILISAFDVRFLEIMMPPVARPKILILLQLVSVAEQTGLNRGPHMNSVLS